MATMKTAQEIEDLAQILYGLSDKHWGMCEGAKDPCDVAVCLKCGTVVYSCQPGWAERQCQCDSND